MTENTKVILKQKRAEGYIDVAVTVMIVAFVLIFAVNLVSLVALHQNVKTIDDQLTEYASMKGTTEIGSYAEELRKKTGIDFAYSFASSTTMDSSGKVQLGERIVCTVRFQSSMIGFGDVIHPIDIQASSSRLSQVYWK